ncbi:MAG: YafY family protein [Bacteroidota bacterium]
MNRIDRLSAILIHLQSKKVVKAQEIADRFEISLRSVYRDIRALEEAGVPIGAEAGVGYYLSEHYRLPPVQFTPEEASALLLAGKLGAKFSDQQISKDIDQALMKVKSILQVDTQDQVSELEERVQVSLSPNYSSGHETLFLSEIQKGILQKQVLTFEYYSYYSGEVAPREVEPISLSFYSNRWHLMAYSRKREDFRNFRLDRISKLQLTPTFFKEKDPKLYQKFLDSMVYQGDVYKVVLHFKREALRYVGEQKYMYGWTGEKSLDDKVEMEFLIGSLPRFSRWLLGFGDKVAIISPKLLQEEMMVRVQELVDHYWKNSGTLLT